MLVTKQRIIEGLACRPAQTLPASPPGDASVALVISNTPDPTVTLCVKAAHLRTHAGEVSLPGGKHESNDPDGLAAALRELHEETGIALTRLHCVGPLDQIYSLHQLRVTPWVLWSDAPVQGVSCEVEIARVFQCALSRLLASPVQFERSRHRAASGLWMPRWEYDGEVIWGLTALILANFMDYALNQPLPFPTQEDARPE